MGNLGGYQEITTAAKAAGGPDKLIAIIESEAAKKAAPGQRGQGAAMAIGAFVALALAKQGWDKFQTARVAASDARASEAKAQLKDLIEQGDAETVGDDVPGDAGSDDSGG